MSLELPPQPEFVGVARMAVATFARHHAFSEEQVDDLKVAVSEAVTNALRAHTAAGISDPLMLSFHMGGDVMSIEVLDRGGGFCPELVDLDRAPDDAEGGLGLTVIRSLFSETTFERDVAGGTRLRIAAKRESEPGPQG